MTGYFTIKNMKIWFTQKLIVTFDFFVDKIRPDKLIDKNAQILAGNLFLKTVCLGKKDFATTE